MTETFLYGKTEVFLRWEVKMLSHLKYFLYLSCGSLRFY